MAMNGDVRRPFTVSVEGNIEAGKSEFIEFCDVIGVFDICVKPVEGWIDINRDQYHHLLESYKKDPKTWGLAFRIMESLGFLQTMMKETTHTLRVIEGSLSSLRYCFVKQMVSDGILESGQTSILEQWYKFCNQYQHAKPDLIVYLRSYPSICYHRMKENGYVTLEYLKKIHVLMEEWTVKEMQDFKARRGGTAVITIDVTRPLRHLKEEFEDCIDSIMWAADGAM